MQYRFDFVSNTINALSHDASHSAPQQPTARPQFARAEKNERVRPFITAGEVSLVRDLQILLPITG
jgi:hypothetical protein